MLLIVNFSKTLTLAAQKLPGFTLLDVANQIALEFEEELDESVEQTFVVSVLAQPTTAAEEAEEVTALTIAGHTPANTNAATDSGTDSDMGRDNLAEAEFGPTNLATLLAAQTQNQNNEDSSKHRLLGSYKYQHWLEFEVDKVNYNRLSEQLLYWAGLGGKYAYLPLPFASPSSASDSDDDDDNTAAAAFLVEDKTQSGKAIVMGVGALDWKDSGPVVIIPPDDPTLALFVGHAISHYLSDEEIWSGLYIVTSLNPLRLVEWD